MNRVLLRVAAILAQFACFLWPLGGQWLSPLLMLPAAAPRILGHRRRLNHRSLFLISLAWMIVWLWHAPAGWQDELYLLALAPPFLALCGGVLPARLWRRGMLLGGLIAASAALIQAFWGSAIPDHWLGSAWPWGRAVGTFGNPNVLGAYLAAMLPLALSMRGSRRLRYGTAVLMGAALLASGSRGGWLAGLAGAGLLVHYRRPKALPLLILVALTLVILPTPVGLRLRYGLAGLDSTVTSRWSIWQAAWQTWRHFPLFGGGLATLIGGTHPHNLFLEAAVKGGLVGLAGFLPAAGILARSIRRPPGRFSQAMGASCLALLVFGGGESFLTQPVLSGLFWFALGHFARKELLHGESS